MTDPSDTVMPISARLTHLGQEAAAQGETVTLSWIMDHLHERAFGLFLLILALPCCIPFLYVVPQIVALPLMFIAAQVLLGRKVPWLPEKLGARTVTSEALQTIANRAERWLRRIEGLSRPRLVALTRAPADRLVGLALVLFSASILVPLPSTNSVPGLAVVIVSMGLLQRDGILVLLGTLLGTAWIGTLVFLGASLASLLRGWIGL